MNSEVFRYSRLPFWSCSAISLLLLIPGIFRLLNIHDLTGQLPPWSMVTVFCLASVICAVLAIGMGRIRIIADTHGLLWRGLGKKESARWEDVIDYFVMKDSHGFRASIVKFTNRRTLKFDSHYVGQRRLELWISRHATQAKPSGWLVQSRAGTITGKIFCSYTRKQYRTTISLLTLPPSFFLLLGIIFPFLQDQKGNSIGWQGVLVGIIPACLIGLFIPAAHQEHLKHLGESFEADTQGFTFIDSQGKSTYVPWTEVRQLKNIGSNLAQKWLLETSEESFPIFATLENHLALITLVRMHSSLPVVMQRASTGALIPTEKTDGRRTFHYQTRVNRIVLGALLALNLFPLWLSWGLFTTSQQYASSSELLPLIWLPLLVSGFLTLWWAGALWRYKTLRIVLDSERITQYHLRHQTRICYDEIARLITSKGNCYLETASGERTVSWSTEIADGHELYNELETRTNLSFSDGYSIARTPEEAKR